MQIIKLKHANQIPRGELSLVLKTLKAGGVMAFPTETTYSLGCDPRNKKAVARIYRIKGRKKGKPFPLVAASVAQVRLIAHLPMGEGASPLRKLMKHYWPGSLTLILNGTAIRVSSHPLVRQITRAFGYPIIATSANKSGEPECRSGQAVIQIFCRGGVSPPGRDNRARTPDLILDAGTLPRRKPSTIARVRQDGTIEVLRQGAIRL
jgi:L-threonylcarbamoyladenylate synthase